MTDHFTITAGTAGPWRSLQSCLRASHDQARAQIAKAIAEREKLGVPLDNDGDWRADVDEALKEAKGAKTQTEAREALRRALARSQRGLAPLPEYVDDPDLDGVEVKFRALSKADVLEMHAARAAEVSDVADEDDSPKANAARLRALAAQHRASIPFIAKALAGVRGVSIGETDLPTWEADGDEECPNTLVKTLDGLGLLPALFTAAQDFMALSGKARATFGVLPLSTSPSSTAPGAQRNDERSSDATAAHRVVISEEPPTRLIAVQDGTSSTAHSAEQRSSSTASLTASPEFPV